MLDRDQKLYIFTVEKLSLLKRAVLSSLLYGMMWNTQVDRDLELQNFAVDKFVIKSALCKLVLLDKPY